MAGLRSVYKINPKLLQLCSFTFTIVVSQGYTTDHSSLRATPAGLVWKLWEEGVFSCSDVWNSSQVNINRSAKGVRKTQHRQWDNSRPVRSLKTAQCDSFSALLVATPPKFKGCCSSVNSKQAWKLTGKPTLSNLNIYAFNLLLKINLRRENCLFALAKAFI